MITLGDRAFALLQHVLPKHLMSRIVYRLTRSERPWLRNRLLSMFIKGYQVNLEEAVESNPFAYRSFNAFFTRALKPGVREVETDATAFVSPVDGTVSQCGRIDDQDIFQAKGQSYSLLELLGGDHDRAHKYRGGSFATIYLAPYNYHRIHMPFGGIVRETVYVPGDLYSVNASTARTVPRVFARNERVVCDFAIPHDNRKHFAMAYIGALHVGSIETTWCGEVNPLPRARTKAVRINQGVGTLLAKGDEAGRFNMGSTVIIVAPPDFVVWETSLQPGGLVKMGARIGTVVT